MYDLLSSPLAGKRDIVVTILFGVYACVRKSVLSCVRASVRISKQFGTVVAFEEEK